MAIGLALGLAGSLIAARLIATLLFAVKPADPATFAAARILAGIMLAASYIPARRATRVDPLEALKFE